MLTAHDPEAARSAKRVELQGIDHLAFVTDDMIGTIAFYTKILGLQLVHVRRVPFAPDRGQPPYDNCRHYFFDMGNESLLAFFEYPADAPKANRDAVGGMQHVAFHADRATFERCRERLTSHGVAVAGPFHLGGRFYSIYFKDNNGIRLEVTTDLNVDDYDPVATVRQTEAEAREELATLGVSPAELEEILSGMPLVS
jgi:catechol 2,3-dioxygenase-like lactoylglutathione lyase family enzyme